MNGRRVDRPSPVVAWLDRWTCDDIDGGMTAVTLVALAGMLVSAFVPFDAEEVRRYVPASFAALILVSFTAAFFWPTFTATKQLARRLLLIIAGTALVTAALGASAQAPPIQCPEPPDLSTALLPRLFFLVAVIAGMLWSAQALVEPVKRSIRRRWWNMGAGDGAAPPNWEGILDMLCHQSSDPMQLEAGAPYPDGKGEIRVELSIATMGAFACVVALGILFGIALDYIRYPRVPTIFINDEKVAELASLSANLTAFLALIAAAISILFTYQQLRAKVRADSRQAWVTKVRKLTANVLENIHGITAHKGDSLAFKRFNKSRTLLELHLNPAEKDHRLLMLLIRACAFPGTVIDNDRVTARQLAAAMRAWRKDRQGGFDKRQYVLLRRALSVYLSNARASVSRKTFLVKNVDDLISFMFKLSHAILKREWERVRHTR